MKTTDLLVVSTFLVIVGGCRTVKDEPVVTGSHIGQREVFVRADINSDGKLSHHEVAIHHHEEQLELFDLDNDHHISRAEWAAAHPGAGDADEHFNSFDKDSDGHISKSEAVTFVTEHVSFGDKFKQYDANGDFHLHWEELDENAPTELNVTLFSLHPNA